MGVRSQPGAGSSFWFSLPLAAPDPSAATLARWLPSEWEPRRHAKLAARLQLVPRIVVLEPHDVLRTAACRYLDGVEVDAAASPAEARTLLAASPAQVLLIGAESPEQATAWVDELRDLPYATPVIACALPMPSGNGLGIAGYLTKPVSRTQLLQAVENLGSPVRSILLADDEPEALQLFGRILATGPQRYRVLQASRRCARGLSAISRRKRRRETTDERRLGKKSQGRTTLRQASICAGSRRVTSGSRSKPASAEMMCCR